MAAVFYWSQKKPQTGSRAVKGRPYSRSWIVFEGRREGQFPIPSVSLRSTSPLDKGSRPLPYQRNARFPVGVGEPLGTPASSVTLRVPPSPKGEGRGMGLPKPSPLGEGVTRSVTDEVSGQRPPAAGLGPAPTRKMGPSLYPCRGGCPHPPAVPLSRT